MTATRAPVTADPTGTASLRPPMLHPHQRSTLPPPTFPPLRGLLPLLALLAAWELVGDPASPYYPPPSTWARAVARLWRDGALVPAAADSLGTFVVALGAATMVGTALGLLVGRSAAVDRALRPTLEFTRVMPPAAMVPVAALLIGYGERMKLVIVTLSALWPVLFSTKAGVRGLPPTLYDVARSLHLGPLDRVRKVTLPALLPSIFVGVRVAAPVALVITLLVEFLTQLEGLGALIGTAQRTYQSARVYGLILVAGLFSLAVSGAVSLLEAYAFRNRPAR